MTESAHRGDKYAEHPFSRVVADFTLDVGRKPKRSGYRPPEARSSDCWVGITSPIAEYVPVGDMQPSDTPASSFDRCHPR